MRTSRRPEPVSPEVAPMTKTLVLAVIAALGLPGLASAEIFRCQARGASVSYQQMPCDGDMQGVVARIATDYPPVNTVERERLFEREAAMYQRLEAERDRLARIEAVRVSMPRWEPAPPPPEVVYV